MLNALVVDADWSTVSPRVIVQKITNHCHLLMPAIVGQQTMQGHFFQKRPKSLPLLSCNACKTRSSSQVIFALVLELMFYLDR